MKTAVSIPDAIFERGESLARRLSKTRSQLYAEALDEYVARHDPDTVTERLNAVVDAAGGDADRFVEETSSSVLRQVEW